MGLQKVIHDWATEFTHPAHIETAPGVRNPLPVQEGRVWSLGRKDVLEEMAPPYRILAQIIPWIRGAWQVTVRGGHRKVGHNLVTKQHPQICILLQKDLKRSSESTLKHYYYHYFVLKCPENTPTYYNWKIKWGIGALICHKTDHASYNWPSNQVRLIT